MPIHVQKMIRKRSMALSLVVFATYFKWKEGGRMNATGVQKTEPNIARNLSVLSPSIIVTNTVNKTINDRFKFLNIYLFLVLAQPEYKYVSMIILTG